ncbi:hypothetical protein AJ80_07946 [Polytolypa hystricis UAMH7299]|uniref:Uncharacterized protein n=1 Tax=Polytolypa hystricis (strain UAMH7299) TaxID=1447883 RepID=A0A2B7XG41_POLH7|nr:hypothetical protein AJ80_07946 [Polytolypa hystricis UAMH7299]
MASTCQVFQFEGNNEQYIQYLEHWLSWILNAVPPILQVDRVPRQNIQRCELDNSQGLRAEKQELKVIPYNYLKTFLKEIPDLKSWNNFREANCFHTSEQNKFIIASLLSVQTIKLDGPAISSPTTHGSASLIGLFTVFHAYTVKTGEWAAKNELAAKLANFHQIIVASMCVVLLQVSARIKTVELIRKASINNSQLQQLEKYHYTAVWINQVISQTSHSSWGHWSAEIFFLSLSPSFW